MQTFVRLEDLSVPYAASICEHLLAEDRQSTSAQSRFLDACRTHNRGELDVAQLAEVTLRLGFNNVVDAFHISRGGEPTQTRFYIDERATRHGITLTDDLLNLANGLQAQVLPLEVDARWNLVQTSWGLGLGTRLVSFEITPDKDAVDLHAPSRLRRAPITGVRDALSATRTVAAPTVGSHSPTSGRARWPSITCCRSSSCRADGTMVTFTRSGISSWPATAAIPRNATARPLRIGCPG